MSVKTTPDPTARRAAFRVEQHGTDYIPESERHSSPRDLRAILVGGSLAFSVIIIGTFPIFFGLSWWQAASAIVVGSALGAVFLAPTGTIAPRTGTNNPVSSGAFFGVGGRLIGSVLEAVASLIFAALSIWTGGDALAGAIERVFDTASPDWTRPLCYGVLAVVVTTISVLGHGSMVFAQRVMIPTAGACMLLGLFVYGGDFDPSYAGGGEYMLGSAPAAWFLAVLTCCSTIASYGPYTGDWTRHIAPSVHSDKSIVRALFLGGLFGLAGPFMWGAFIAVCLFQSGAADPSSSFVLAMTQSSPLWYLPAIVFIGLASGTAQAVINTYGTGLDTSSMIPKLSRPQATLVACAAATVLVFIGHYNAGIITGTSTLLTLLADFSIPWIVILAIGHYRNGPRYHVEDLQVFNRGERGGAYWFTHGFNLPTIGIWGLASVVGLLFASNTWFTGPGAELLGGIDVGFAVGAVVAGALYLPLTRKTGVRTIETAPPATAFAEI